MSAAACLGLILHCSSTCADVYTLHASQADVCEEPEGIH
jgi:hypothetical protein